MLNLIKPGHVLQFGVCPSTLTPPGAAKGENDNTRVEKWSDGKKTLGNVACLTHPSGPLGPICADVATSLRGGGRLRKIGRGLSYSPLGRSVRAKQNRQDVRVGAANADFVGYTDGRTNYVQSNSMVFSKDFSGCLMVEYTVNGARRVAHAAASSKPAMDCQQAFLTTLRNDTNAQLTGWFRPFVDAIDGDRKIRVFHVVKGYINNQINRLTTFGVIAGGRAYAIDAFKPNNGPARHWVVATVTAKVMSRALTA